eukprot:3066885-Amphidinium_carterae.1
MLLSASCGKLPVKPFIPRSNIARNVIPFKPSAYSGNIPVNALLSMSRTANLFHPVLACNHME